MKYHEILTVEECFVISGRGLILHPDFSVPSEGWKTREENIRICYPDGSEIELTASFSLTHFNIPDPDTAIDKRWRVVVCIDGSDRIPAGSKVLASSELRDALVG